MVVLIKYGGFYIVASLLRIANVICIWFILGFISINEYHCCECTFRLDVRHGKSEVSHEGLGRGSTSEVFLTLMVVK